MKRITNVLCICMLLAYSVTAQINTPQPSSAGSVSSTVGLTEVSIEYFRPKKKGRQIFGSGDEFLEQYGNIWRTGANSGSKLTLSTDVKIGGQDVTAGTYLIFTIPNADEWKFMLYSDLSLGGNVAGYDKSKEVLNISVKPIALDQPVETLTFQISDISEDNTSANLHFAWDRASFKVPIQVNFDEQVMASIEANTMVNPQNYLAAARYYLSTDKDLDQALTWINQYLEVGENSQQFWNLHTKARILAKLGEKKKAIKTAEESMKLAKEYSRGDFGYVKRNEELISSLN
ncbi:MAG: DUF2911 domain-containing protein [Bacteroidota bacterium]